ncbi:response regulator [Sediminicola luteus]|uniref:Response regulator n=1 Tax=Sediminicola luteus TaxID=319238 RepID=A0A2A4GCS7_9FLAO|nr:response regulator [Sediminicola luteus]PCE66263.1 response regulator [Sediminicola luteus]
MYSEIFLVDDEELVNTINKFQLKRLGFDKEVTSYINPEQAWEALRSKQDTHQKILILLDINMPEMSGFEFLDLVVRHEFPESLEVVIVTSSESQSDRDRALTYKRYVKDFIPKPLSFERLRDFMVHNNG